MPKITTFLLTSALVITAVLGFASILPSPTSAQTCTPDASKQCAGNYLYWYDSCGALQGIAQNCSSTKQICQNGACVDNASASSTTTTTTTTGASTTPTGPDYVTSCYNGNIYWFAKDGSVQNMYKSCDDGNSCTLDNCASRQCVNQLECDGSTCAVGSADYLKYCSGTGSSQTTTGTQTTTGQTTTTQPPVTGQGLSIAVFASKNSGASLQKNITANANDKINFLLIVRNTSDSAIDDVSVQSDLTSNLTYSGNLEIDNITSAGNVASGIDLGTIGPKISREISFTTTVNPVSTQTAAQISSTISVGTAIYDSDYVVLTINGKSTSTTVSSTASAGSSGFSNFLKNWWIWILIIIVLIVVFVIIFRRLSTNV